MLLLGFTHSVRKPLAGISDESDILASAGEMETHGPRKVGPLSSTRPVPVRVDKNSLGSREPRGHTRR